MIDHVRSIAVAVSVLFPLLATLQYIQMRRFGSGFCVALGVSLIMGMGVIAIQFGSTLTAHPWVGIVQIAGCIIMAVGFMGAKA